MKGLDWQDIFVEAPSIDFERLLGLWPNTISGPLRPIGASAFGDCFLERPNGHIERLDVLEGGVQLVAKSFDEFKSVMNSPAWQETNLLSQGVALLRERGLSRESAQFFGFAPHPVFAGKIDWHRAVVLEPVVWHSICASILDAPPSAVGT